MHEAHELAGSAGSVGGIQILLTEWLQGRSNENITNEAMCWNTILYHKQLHLRVSYFGFMYFPCFPGLPVASLGI